MLSFIWGIIIIITTFYIGMIYNSTSILLLCIMEVIVMMLSFGILKFNDKRFQATIEVPISVAEANKPVTVDVVIYNGSGMVLNKAKVLVKYGNSMDKKCQKKWIVLNNVFPGKQRKSFKVILPTAGSYYFEIKKLKVYEPLGIMYFSRKQEGEDSAMVLPQMDVIPITLSESIRNFCSDADVYDDLRPGSDSSQIFDVREYRDGDKIQSIHWKLSAKTDELIVRENSMPKACALIMYLDGQAAKNSEDFWKYAASFSFSLMDNGCPHFATWYSKAENDIIRARVDDEESYYIFLTTFMRDVCVSEKVDIVSLYEEKHRGENAMYHLYIGDVIKLNDQVIDEEHLELNL